jgi:hypothetical protein
VSQQKQQISTDGGFVASRAIEITSKLALEQRSALERLLFFNLNQYRVRDGIQESIATYGVPEIYEHDNSLRISVGDVAGVQSLFAVTDAGLPLGLAVYVRTAPERFVVLHLVVEPESFGASTSNTQILLKLMHEIRGAARRTRGVDRIELVYKRERLVQLHS